MSVMISLDTETTGLSMHHGARPFLVTTCGEGGEQRWWQWDVDPLTRTPTIPDEDVAVIQDCINNVELLVLQNSKFDAQALTSIGVVFPWHKVRDTLMAGHLLASNHRHNLTDMCIEFLGIDIEPWEVKVEKATKEARRIVKQVIKHDASAGLPCGFEGWRLADEGDPMLPSVKSSSSRDEDKPWKNDMWLCRLLWQMGVAEDATWEHACSDYANTDSAVTLPLWKWQETEIKRRGLWNVYLERLKLLSIAFGMEQRGVTASGKQTQGLITEYSRDVVAAKQLLTMIAADHGHDLELPVGASPNDSLREMFFGSTRLVCPRCATERKHKEWSAGPADGALCAKCEKKGVLAQCNVVRNLCLDLPKQYNAAAKSASPTLNSTAMDHYETTLDEGPALQFVTALKGMRSRQTAVSYAQSYEKFWLPVQVPSNATWGHACGGVNHHGWFRLHPSLNPTGTDTIRWSSYNPNAQNISRKEDFNLRRCFGPMPGREWWSMDFKSIESRIPVYESGEPKMLEIFERPNEAPYWGNLYCLTASVLYPDEYWPLAEIEGEFRKRHPRLYKQSKFFVLAKQYGCGRKKGDLLSKVAGSFDKVDSEFPLFAALQRKYILFADRHGYVETIPDRLVDPERGYPILVSRTEDGHVSGTTPFNYHVSGTAMQTTNAAMVETEHQVREWNEDGWDGFLTLQVHDELVWDCPRGTGSEPWRRNLPRMRKLAALMEACGERIGVPTPVSREWHGETWATGLSV